MRLEAVIGVRKVRAGKIGLRQRRTVELCVGKIDGREIGSRQVVAEKVRARQVRPLEIDAAEIEKREVLSGKIKLCARLRVEQGLDDLMER